MKKKSLIDIIEYKYLDFFSCFLLILWAISPVIEYFLKNCKPILSYTSYFVSIIYFVGFLGIIEYLFFLYKKVKDKCFNIKEFIPQILIAILLVLSIISSIFSENPTLSFFGENYRKEGLLVYIMYIGFILSSSLIVNKKHINNIFKIIVFSSVFITTTPLFSSDFTYFYFSNIYHNPNHYGYFLMISTMLAGFMFLCNRGVKKPFYLCIYVYLIHMLIRNDTFGCFLSISICLLFSVVYSFIKKFKRFDIITLALVFLISSVVISKFDIKIGERIFNNQKQQIVLNNVTSFANDVKTVVKSKDKKLLNSVGTNRGLLWKGAVEYTLDHPLIGGGMECLNNYYEGNRDRPHNVILQFSCFIGIPGAIIYVILILYLGITRFKYLNKHPINFTICITAMCYFISSMFGNSMYYTSPYFMILLGFLIGINESMKKDKELLNEE